jgi:putative lipoic acid-binding regulatory protein
MLASKDNSKMVRNAEEEHINGQMVHTMKESSKTTLLKVSVTINGQMAENM